MAYNRPKSLDELNSIFDKTIAAEKAIKKNSSKLESGEDSFSSFSEDAAPEGDKKPVTAETPSEPISEKVSDFIAKFSADPEPVKTKPQMTVLAPEAPIKADAIITDSSAHDAEAVPTDKSSRDELFKDYARIMSDEDDDAADEKKLSRKEKKLLKKREKAEKKAAREKAAREKAVTEEPVIEEPVIEEPAIEEPVIEEPAIEEPAIEEPVIEEPAIEEPVIEEPAIEEPAIEEPAIEEPVIEEPVIEEPVIEEPVIEEPVIEEPVIEEPVIEEPVIEEPVIEEPVIEEPVIEEPVIEEPDYTEDEYQNSADDEADDFNFPEDHIPEWMKEEEKYEEIEDPLAEKTKALHVFLKVLLSLVLVAVISIGALATVFKTVVAVNTGKLVSDKYYVFTTYKDYKELGLSKGDLVITEKKFAEEGEVFAYVDYSSKSFEFGKRTDSITKDDGEVLYVTEKDGGRTLVSRDDCKGVVCLTYAGRGNIVSFLTDNYIILVASAAVISLTVILVFALALRTKKEEEISEYEMAGEREEDFEDIFSTIE